MAVVVVQTPSPPTSGVRLGELGGPTARKAVRDWKLIEDRNAQTPFRELVYLTLHNRPYSI